MFDPIIDIQPGQVCRFDHQQVLRILFFRSSGKVKRPGNDRLPIQYHDLIMGNGMAGVNVCWNPDVGEECCPGIVILLLASVEDDLDFDPSLVGFEKGLGDGLGREGEGLDEDF